MQNLYGKRPRSAGKDGVKTIWVQLEWKIANNERHTELIGILYPLGA